jgi:erythrocyte band 7 integral membrane protein
MSHEVNGGGSSKAPESDANIGFQPQNKMTVQPPRQEDLQRSYATIVTQDMGAQGWYGSMSKLPFFDGLLTHYARPVV